MTPSIANEPWAALGTYIKAAQSEDAVPVTLLSKVGRDAANNPMIFAEMPIDAGPYPRVTWRVIGESPGNTDVENDLDRWALLQIDVLCSSPATMRDMKMILDTLNRAYLADAKPLDTTHWVTRIFRCLSGWRALSIPIEIQNDNGMPVLMAASDWRFTYARRQTVA